MEKFLAGVGILLLFFAIGGQIRLSLQFAVKDPFNPAYWENSTFYTLSVAALFFMAAGLWH